jgi:hypothetical protein
MKIIKNIDWNNKSKENPLANQKNILIIEDINIIAHTFIENEPIYFYKL